MKVIIGNCSSGKDYVEIEAIWINIMPADLRTRQEIGLLDDEGYCNVKMLIKEEDLSELDAACIFNLCVLYKEDSWEMGLCVDFFTSDDIDINRLKEE